jgi:hypothetical protein
MAPRLDPATLKLDRAKYQEIAQKQGLGAALTALHRDTEQLEYQTFEGEQGYQEKLWNFLEEVRKFSRELWEADLRRGQSAPPAS